MKTFDIEIGKGRNPMTLDAAEIIGSCLLIQGARKSGKSYLARVIAEQTVPKFQTIILDSEGEFSTLREKCGLLIAGKEGDVPCEVKSAKLLAKRIAETGVSAVVDFSDLKPDDRRIFVRDFLSVFNTLPKKLQDRPRLFVIDEAHVYCPESGKGQAASTEQVVLLLSAGRKRGFGTILLTQRLSKLKNDAASECGTILIGKTSPIDAARAQDLLGLERKERDALKRLKPGTFYGDGNALPADEPVQFQVRKAATTHPEPGVRYKMKTPPPQRAIKKILAEFEALPPPQDVEDAKNLSEAQAEIRKLTKALAKAGTSSDGASVKSLEQQLDRAMVAVDNALETGIQRERARVYRMLRKIPGIIRAILQKPVSDIHDSLERAAEAVVVILEPPVASKRRHPLGRTGGSRDLSLKPGLKVAPRSPMGVEADFRRRMQGDPAPSGHVGELGFSWTSAPGKLLTVLIQWNEVMGQRRVAALAGVNYKSSTFRNALTKLRQVEGLIGHEGKGIWVTDSGRSQYADHVEKLPSGDALLEGWRARLGGVPLAIFNALIDAGGKGERHGICAEAGTDPSSSTARNAYTKLRNLGLLETGWSKQILQLTEHVLEAMA